MILVLVREQMLLENLKRISIRSQHYSKLHRTQRHDQHESYQIFVVDFVLGDIEIVPKLMVDVL